MGILIKVSRSGLNHTEHVDKWCRYWISIEISIFHETRDTEENLNPEIRFRCVRHMVRLNSILKAHFDVFFFFATNIHSKSTHEFESTLSRAVQIDVKTLSPSAISKNRRRQTTTETKATRAHHAECYCFRFKGRNGAVSPHIFLIYFSTMPMSLPFYRHSECFGTRWSKQPARRQWK